MRLKTNSENFTSASILIFLMTFLNTAIVILIGNADVKNALPLLGFLMHGKYNDYSPDWFEDIGEILVISMVINIFIPIIEFSAETFL